MAHCGGLVVACALRQARCGRNIVAGGLRREVCSGRVTAGELKPGITAWICGLVRKADECSHSSLSI